MDKRRPILRTMMTQPEMRYLRLPEVMRMTGLSKASIYRGMESGDFPRNKKLGPRCVGWLSTDVYDWMMRRLG